MPTLEYKIRKLAEILAEQGVHLMTITLDEAEWASFVKEGRHPNDVTNVTLFVGDDQVELVRDGVKVDLSKHPYLARPGQVVPLAPGQAPPMQVSAITSSSPNVTIPWEQ